MILSIFLGFTSSLLEVWPKNSSATGSIFTIKLALSVATMIVGIVLVVKEKRDEARMEEEGKRIKEDTIAIKKEMFRRIV